jgi:hypothetical protein
MGSRWRRDHASDRERSNRLLNFYPLALTQWGVPQGAEPFSAVCGTNDKVARCAAWRVNGVAALKLFGAALMMSESAATGIVVLIVEDEPMLRMYAVDIIEEAGFTAVEADSADEAVRILEIERTFESYSPTLRCRDR